MINGISGASAVQSVGAPDKDGGAEAGKKAASTSNNIGPAVVVSLTNPASTKNDMAQGDPDHDGH